MAEYVSNKRLREVITEYNRTNINDKGEWCASYLQRLENKFKKGKIDAENFELSKSFILNKVKEINELQERYRAMSELDKRRFDMNFRKLTEEMCGYFSLIINGRINSFKLRSTMKNIENLDDIIQDAMICILSYVNRYDESRGTSAFAYITQLASNSIILSIKKLKENEEKYITGLDFFENLNTIDDVQGTSGLNKLIE